MPTPARNHRGADGCSGDRGDHDPAGEFALNLRAPVFALSAVLLSTAAHVAGGGEVPGPGPIVLLVVAVDLVFRTLVRRELSFVQVMAGVAVAQLGLHVVMAAGHASHPAGQVTGPVLGQAMDQAMDQATGQATGRVMGHAAGHVLAGLPDDVLMLLAHVAAAAALAWWLRRGEAAAWRGARRLILALLRLPVPARVDRPTVPRRPRTGLRPAGPLVLAVAAHPRRGPPPTA